MNILFVITKCVVEIFLKIFCGENSNDIRKENKLKREKLEQAIKEIEKTNQRLNAWEEEILKSWQQES